MNAPPPLFRPAAVAAQRHDSHGRIVLTSAWSLTLLGAFLAAVACALILLAFFGSYTTHTTLRGRLVVARGVVEVTSTAAGTIVERRAAEGRRVTAGETLYVVSSESFSQAGTATGQRIAAQLAHRRASLVAQIASTAELEKAERAALGMRRAALRSELATLDEALVAERRRLGLASAAAERYASMRSQGFVAEEQRAQREAALLEQQSRIDGLQRERASLARLDAELEGRAATLPLERAHAVAELERAVAGTDLAIAENDARRASIVSAPASGTVTAPMGEIAEPVERGHVLARIVPDDAVLAAELLAPSRAVGFVAAGAEVRLRYAAFPYQKFGQAPGTVVSVSEAPLAPTDGAARAGARGEPVYRVVVALRSQAVMAYGAPRRLLPGMEVEADVLLETRRLYEWALEPLYALAGRVRH
ncbi:MAG TPA: HlyD family efflux transporter periplasmic adaptor subunit [Gammaproteobacteria bacterium]